VYRNEQEKVMGPVIVWATGTISKSFSNIPEKHDVKELQKNSHMGHCTCTSETTTVKVQNI
jgi:hypothetical protein